MMNLRTLSTLSIAVSALTLAGCQDATAPASGGRVFGPRLAIVRTTNAQISAGGRHTCALKADSTIVCWGGNGSGETTVPGAAASHMVQVETGFDNTCAVKNDGSLYCWGWDGVGKSTVPAEASSDVVQVSAGESHTCALKIDGSVVCWGSNSDGQTTVPAEASSDVREVAAGGSHSCALKSDGSVVCWGYNHDGETTVPAEASSDVEHLAAGGVHTCALKTDGSVVCWGANDFGQTTVPAEASNDVAQVVTGAYHTCALKTDGSILCWGWNIEGQTAVPVEASSDVAQVAAGFETNCALKRDGSVICWGDDSDGQATVPSDLNLYAHRYPRANLQAPNAVEAGTSFDLSLNRARVIGVPASTFLYSFDCGDGNGYSSYGADNTVSCPTSATGTLNVGGKVKDQDGDISTYTKSVTVQVFTSSCTYVVSGTVADVTVSWSDASIPVTQVSVTSGNRTPKRNFVTKTNGSWTRRVRWHSAAPPTYEIKGGTAYRDTSTTLVAAGAACTEF